MKKHRFGMVIDLDRCTGCGACVMACAVENNVPPAAADATENTGLSWMRVSRAGDGGAYPRGDVAYIPMMCQQCETEAPCVSVCPQNAVEVDPQTGIVAQVPQRCLGCRYCMAACPYHARSFNWHDPRWDEGSERLLNPDVSPRMRGVAEKCNFCHGRLHSAMEKAAAAGLDDIAPADYEPACVAACPEQAIVFGDLDDASSGAARAAGGGDAFRFLPRLGTEPKVYYRSSRRWVHDMARTSPKNVEGGSNAA
jgi:menaquinone reductase, iron-sulfur cluster-binding subunit